MTPGSSTSDDSNSDADSTGDGDDEGTLGRV